MRQIWASLLSPGGCREAGHLYQCAVVPAVCLFFERLASIVICLMRVVVWQAKKQAAGPGTDPIGAPT